MRNNKKPLTNVNLSVIIYLSLLLTEHRALWGNKDELPTVWASRFRMLFFCYFLGGNYVESICVG